MYFVSDVCVDVGGGGGGGSNKLLYMVNADNTNKLCDNAPAEHNNQNNIRYTQ